MFEKQDRKRKVLGFLRGSDTYTTPTGTDWEKHPPELIKHGDWIWSAEGVIAL